MMAPYRISTSVFSTVRVEKGMPNFDASKIANDNIAALCAYLKARSDGAIQPGR